MGSSMVSWRMSIGLFYNKAYGMIKSTYLGKIVFDFSYLFFVFKFKKTHVLFCNSLVKCIFSLERVTVVLLLLLLSGDVESNPGPNSQTEHSISILHCNIRSIRSKLEYILNNFCDYDLLCFTETHLDDSVTDEAVYLSLNFDVPYRKDRSCHGGGILVYINSCLIHKRRTDL